MRPDIENLCQSINQYRPITYDETVAELKRMYDGYHFSKKMTDVYNPWSLIYAFEQGSIDNYWFSTGTPSSLISLLRTRYVSLPDLEHIETNLERFDAPTERISDPVPALFQSGYLTIKEYLKEDNMYVLGFPNEEVHCGFARSLYNYYLEDEYEAKYRMVDAYRHFRRKKIDLAQFLEATRRWYAGIPYSASDRNQNEQFYQTLFYALLLGLGADVRAEEQTSDGRMDIVLRMQDGIYILEFKYDRTAEEATEQIRRKRYADSLAADARPVYAVGLNISADRRTIESYDIDQLK